MKRTSVAAVLFSIIAIGVRWVRQGVALPRVHFKSKREERSSKMAAVVRCLFLSLMAFWSLALQAASAYVQPYGPPTYAVGDTWTFKEGRSTSREVTVLAVDANGYIIKGLYNGCPACLIRTDKNGVWLAMLNADGKPVDVTQYQFVPVGSNWKLIDFPLEVNNIWNTSALGFINNQPVRYQADFKVEAYEDVKTPAGTFKAYRIRSVVTLRASGWSIDYQVVRWFAPDAKSVVKLTTTLQGASDYELVFYSLK